MSIKAEGRVTYAARVKIGVSWRGQGGQRQFGEHVQHIIRAPENRQRIEVLSPPSRAGALIVSNGRVEWEYDPRRNMARRRTLPSLEEQVRERLSALDLVRDTLHATLVGTATVAGRKCHVVAVKPPDGKRTRKKIWIDVANHIELKWERYRPDGSKSATWTVVDLDLTPYITPGMFEFHLPAGCRVHEMPRAEKMPLEQAEAVVGFRAVIPRTLPPGFVLHRNYVRVAQFRGRQALWLQFLDGVDRFSLFQSRQLPNPPARVSRAMYWEVGGYSFLLVGRLSPHDVELIKRGTQP